jgi:hypothetical protein
LPGKKVFSLRVRLMLALVGILVVISSVLLLFILDQKPSHDQLRITPPPTLFAPPEVEP